MRRWPWVQRILWGFESVLIGLTIAVLRLLRPDQAAAAGGWILRQVGPRQKKSRHLRRNYSIAFPDLDAGGIEALVKASWTNFGACMVEYAHLDDIANGRRGAGLECVVAPGIRALEARDRPAIFFTAHLGNWELAALAIYEQRIPVTAVYSPLPNPGLDRRLAKYRSVLGCKLVPRSDSMRPLLAEVKAGRSIGLLVDQKVENGEPLPFFGRDKMTTLIPARLALRHDLELVPIRIQRLEGSRFRATFLEPVRADAGAGGEIEQARQMMTRVNQLFEEWIRDDPGQWFCGNRRWPKDRQAAGEVTGGKHAAAK
ncbi:MAG: lysophospholipid acyltransferase family protein [Gammaproteobacteria bacterium]